MNKWIIITASTLAAVLAFVMWVTLEAMRYAQGLMPGELSIAAVIAVAVILPILTAPLVELAGGLLGLAIVKNRSERSDLFR